MVEEKGEDIAIKEFRKHLAAYSKNLPNSSNFRVKVNAIDDRLELVKVLDEYFVPLGPGLFGATALEEKVDEKK